LYKGLNQDSEEPVTQEGCTWIFARPTYSGG